MSRKTVFFILFLILTGGLNFIFAETAVAAVYPKTVPISRIYPHKLGYRVDYIKADRSLGTLWAPLEWFQKSSDYGEIVYGKGSQYPYATFFYEGGRISRFKLYLIDNFEDMSWGVLGDGDYDSRFSAEELVVEYR